MLYWTLSFCIILIPVPDFPHFYYILSANLGSLLYGDVPVMKVIFIVITTELLVRATKVFYFATFSVRNTFGGFLKSKSF